MAKVDGIDPEVLPALQSLPRGGLIDWDNLAGARLRLAELGAAAAAPDLLGVHKEDQVIPSLAGAPPVLVRVFRPDAATSPLPGYLWIHGGGWVMGSLAESDRGAQHLVAAVGCIVVSVEYRLAPDHPFPAPLEDCYTALHWMAGHADALGLDPSRIAVGGSSAGANLAAGLALLARDRGTAAIAFQLLLYPALDDRNIVPTRRGDHEPRVINWQDKRDCYRAYLGVEPGGEGVSPYAAPARATELAGLPPAYLMVGTQDVLMEEVIAYAQRLLAAGVPTELHVYPGAYHSSELFAPDAALSRRMIGEWQGALRRALFS